MKFSALSLCLLLTTSLLPAQGPKDKDSAPLSLQGKMLPEVSAFSETGEEIQLQKLLKGRHGVIVFGCLT